MRENTSSGAHATSWCTLTYMYKVPELRTASCIQYMLPVIFSGRNYQVLYKLFGPALLSSSSASFYKKHHRYILSSSLSWLPVIQLIACNVFAEAIMPTLQQNTPLMSPQKPSESTVPRHQARKDSSRSALSGLQRWNLATKLPVDGKRVQYCPATRLRDDAVQKNTGRSWTFLIF